MNPGRTARSSRRVASDLARITSGALSLLLLLALPTVAGNNAAGLLHCFTDDAAVYSSD